MTPRGSHASARLPAAQQDEFDSLVENHGITGTAKRLDITTTLVHRLQFGGGATAAAVERVVLRLVNLKEKGRTE